MILSVLVENFDLKLVSTPEEDIKEIKDIEKVIDVAIKHQKLDNLEFNI